MKQRFKPNWFDLFMLAWATIPFVALAYGPVMIDALHIPSYMWAPLWVFLAMTCLGFPATAWLCFGWRLR